MWENSLRLRTGWAQEGLRGRELGGHPSLREVGQLPASGDGALHSGGGNGASLKLASAEDLVVYQETKHLCSQGFCPMSEDPGRQAQPFPQQRCGPGTQEDSPDDHAQL